MFPSLFSIPKIILNPTNIYKKYSHWYHDIPMISSLVGAHLCPRQACHAGRLRCGWTGGTHRGLTEEHRWNAGLYEPRDVGRETLQQPLGRLFCRPDESWISDWMIGWWGWMVWYSWKNFGFLGLGLGFMGIGVQGLGSFFVQVWFIIFWDGLVFNSHLDLDWIWDCIPELL